jgi:hypothetical protein
VSLPVVRLIAAWTLGNVGFRIALVAMPLLALDRTGSAWTVGLVSGASGIPVISAPWWTRPLQRRLTSVGALSKLMTAEAVTSLLVPVAAACDRLSPAVMIGIGLMTGVLNAVSGPLDYSLLASLGDVRDADRAQRAAPTSAGVGAARLLSAQDGTIKAATTLAPLASLALISVVGLTGTVAADGVLTLCGAAVLIGLRLPGAATPGGPGAPRARDLLRGHSAVRIGLAVRGTGCAAWFAFTLCLAVVGEREGLGIRLATAGLSAYSAGAVVGALLGVWAAGVRRAARLNCHSWLLAGAGWLVIGCHPTVLVTAVTAALMGLVVPTGNAATTALVTRSFAGAERRSMLTVQGTVVNGATTLGALVGGPLIAVVGAQAAIVVAGAVVVAASLTGLLADRTVTALAPEPLGTFEPTRRGRTEAPHTMPEAAILAGHATKGER